MTTEFITPPPLPDVPAPRRRSLVWPAALALAGMCIIALAHHVETRVLSPVPWSEAVIILTEEPPSDDAIPVRLRRIDESNVPPNPIMSELRRRPDVLEQLRMYGVDEPRREWVVALAPSVALTTEMLASGRLPDVGADEVLAGHLARFRSFTLGGREYSVVGTLRPRAAAPAFGYVLPVTDPTEDPLFTEAEGGETGWLLPNGIDEEQAGRLQTSDDEAPPRVMGGFGRIPGALTWGAILGMALVVIGFTFLLTRLFTGYLRIGPFRPLVEEIESRPRLYVFLHLLNYGGWFAFMALAVALPFANFFMVQMLQTVFTSGPLDHVGDAYSSGNIPLAALATFQQNFGVATVMGTILPSLILPFFGVLKNLFSFTTLGFAMSPIWAGRIGGYVYHSVTIAVELEAYILASFIVCVWPIRVVEGLSSGQLGERIGRGARVVLSGTLLIAAILAVAAVYEATTLILLND